MSRESKAGGGSDEAQSNGDIRVERRLQGRRGGLAPKAMTTKKPPSVASAGSMTQNGNPLRDLQAENEAAPGDTVETDGTMAPTRRS